MEERIRAESVSGISQLRFGFDLTEAAFGFAFARVV